MPLQVGAPQYPVTDMLYHVINMLYPVVSRTPGQGLKQGNSKEKR